MTNDHNDQLEHPPRDAVNLGCRPPERIACISAAPSLDPSDPGAWFPDDVEQFVLATTMADWPPGWLTPAEIVAALTARGFWVTVDLAWLNDAGRAAWLREVTTLRQCDIPWMRPEVMVISPSEAPIWEVSEGRYRLHSLVRAAVAEQAQDAC